MRNLHYASSFPTSKLLHDGKARVCFGVRPGMPALARAATVQEKFPKLSSLRLELRVRRASGRSHLLCSTGCFYTFGEPLCRDP